MIDGLQIRCSRLWLIEEATNRQTAKVLEE